MSSVTVEILDQIDIELEHVGVSADAFLFWD